MSKPEKEGYRILYIEDRELYSEDWVKRFESMGHQVVLAATIPEAIAAFRKAPHSFEVVIADLGLPSAEVDGQEFGIGPDDPTGGLRLLELFRREVPQLGLIAYSHLPESSFSSELIASMLANKISFAPIRFGLTTEDVEMIIRFGRKGFVVYPPALAPKLKQVLYEPGMRNPLSDWEYYILHLRCQDRTLGEIAEFTGVPEETIRTDFRDIYLVLEDEGIIAREADDARRDPKTLRDAYAKLESKYGTAVEHGRPKRKARYISPNA